MPPTAAPAPTVTTAISMTTTTAPNSLGLTPAAPNPPSSIEAKLVILGAQGVGKTSLVNRFVNPLAPLPTSSQATIGASFITKRILDPDTNTTVRLQIWDTAGQERFRSISRLYYRGANACLLCYDVTSEKSWEEMKGWLREMRENCDLNSSTSGAGAGMVVHIVGTKTDLVAADPDSRQVTFERTISYVAEHLGGNTTSTTSQSSTPPLSMRPSNLHISTQSPDSKRSSGFWNQDLGWDSCHEISAKDNDGIEEVFRVIARKLVEQRNKREAWEMSHIPGGAGWTGADGNHHNGSSGDYFGSGARARYAGSAGDNSTGSFRIGYGDKRRSWLGLPSMGLSGNHNNNNDDADVGIGDGTQFTNKDVDEARRRGRCC